jgi:hypothetical protein
MARLIPWSLTSHAKHGLRQVNVKTNDPPHQRSSAQRRKSLSSRHPRHLEPSYRQTLTHRHTARSSFLQHYKLMIVGETSPKHNPFQ